MVLTLSELGLLKDKVCIVTGAGHGIGKNITTTFSAEKAKVIAVLHHPETEWINLWNQAGNEAITPICLDVTNSEEIKQLVLRVKKDFGRLDVLVNNAGIVTYEFLTMLSKQSMRQMFEVNVFALIELMQYASRIMMRQKSGSIINISSIVGDQGAGGSACVCCCQRELSLRRRNPRQKSWRPMGFE